MTPAASSFLMRSSTAGAERPTCSPIRASGVRQSSCSSPRIWTSVSSNAASALLPNLIRCLRWGSIRLFGFCAPCQRFIRRKGVFVRVGVLTSGLGLVAVLAVGTADAALVAKQIGAGDTALLFGGADAEGGVGDWY